jgi:hypothetical protein
MAAAVRTVVTAAERVPAKPMENPGSGERSAALHFVLQCNMRRVRPLTGRYPRIAA